jgi:hypothetical protein
VSEDIRTPYDDLPAEDRRERHGWFGDPWWSFVCYDEAGKLIEEMRKDFPVGESCLYCGELFDEAAGDSGTATVAVTMIEGKPVGRIAHVHKECQFRQVAGGLAHHEGRCHCHGGDGEGTPGMTLRQEAVEVWRRMRAGTLFRDAAP